MLVRMADANSGEVGNVGIEGIIGVQAFPGGELGNIETFQHVAGEVRVLPVDDF